VEKNNVASLKPSSNPISGEVFLWGIFREVFPQTHREVSLMTLSFSEPD